MQLAKFRKNGPKFLTICYVIGIVIALLYIILVSAVTGIPFGELIDASTIISLVFSGAMLAANIVYFNKRASLFVN